MIRIAFVFLIALTGGAVAADKVYDFDGQHQEMSAAVETARARISDFLAATDNAQKHGAMFKVGVDAGGDGDRSEHIWMTPCAPSSGGRFACIVANVPHTDRVRQGDLYEFHLNDVSDWAYYTPDGRLRGGYTIRVIMPLMEPDQRAEYERMMSDEP